MQHKSTLRHSPVLSSTGSDEGYNDLCISSHTFTHAHKAPTKTNPPSCLFAPAASQHYALAIPVTSHDRSIRNVTHPEVTFHFSGTFLLLRTTATFPNAFPQEALNVATNSFKIHLPPVTPARDLHSI
uniref:Uncharacterized protein n=1 Tax=Anopheles atroparvus TaxID=41427 RepID=A0AAG5DHR0_ANOAO